MLVGSQCKSGYFGFLVSGLKEEADRKNETITSKIDAEKSGLDVSTELKILEWFHIPICALSF